MKLINNEVRIENTDFCNAACTICPHDKLTRTKTTMPLPHFRRLVDEAVELGAKTISIFGFGEPLMDKGLEKKIRYCADLGLETFITSNGQLLDLMRGEKILEAGLSHIRFSVHGIFHKDYSKIHKGLDYLMVIRNIFNFLIVNKAHFNKSCKVSVSVIPMNGESVEHIKSFWEPHVDYLEIWKPHNWCEGKNFREVQPKLRTCGRPFRGPVQIQADGKMIVCCFDYDGKMVVGDTYRNTIEEILKGKKFEKIREKHMTGRLKGLPCAKCDQLNIGDNPLLYSSRDNHRRIGCTSSTKFNLLEETKR